MPDETRIPEDYDWIETRNTRCTLCHAPVNRFYLFDPVAQARLEHEAEQHRAAVEREKARIRSRAGRSLWQRLFPFKVTITRI